MQPPILFITMASGVKFMYLSPSLVITVWPARLVVSVLKIVVRTSLRNEQECYPYLSSKKAFSVRPATAVATANRKVVVPKVEWIGTRAALKLAVADSQQSSRRKLNTPTRN